MNYDEKVCVNAMKNLIPVLPKIFESFTKVRAMHKESTIILSPVKREHWENVYLEYSLSGISCFRKGGYRDEDHEYFNFSHDEYRNNCTEIDHKYPCITISSYDGSVSFRMDNDKSEKSYFCSIMLEDDWITVNGTSDNGIEAVIFQKSLLDNIRSYEDIMEEVTLASTISSLLPTDTYISCDEPRILTEEMMKCVIEALL